MQALSVRPDVLSPQICRELEALQDSMPSFPYDKAQSIIEHQIKKPVSQLFKEFPRKPIAAASLGQVRVPVCSSVWVGYRLEEEDCEWVFFFHFITRGAP